MSLITEGADLARSAETGARVEPSLAGVGDYVALLVRSICGTTPTSMR